MKKLSFLGKIIFWCNSIIALLLLVSFVLPFIPPKTSPTISLLSLTVSPLIFLTFLFGLYWLLQLKKQWMLSAVMLLAAYFFFNPFYKFSTKEDASNYRNTISVLSYNVRLFNAYEKDVNATHISEVLNNTLKIAEPDVIFIQEYYRDATQKFPEYPYSYIHFKDTKVGLGHAIFSKYPLINKGAFDFKYSYNNSLFADIIKESDTIRLYNVHLKSLGIIPSVESLQVQDKEKLLRRTEKRFEIQQEQVEVILTHMNNSKYPVVLAGDFNNTAFSYIYSKLQEGMKDAFVEKGNGIGTTFRFDSYPMRIDYILTSETLEVLDFDTIDETFSDHFPITAVLGIK
ncbi:MAG: vancomycin resistance protein VanJ [Patiriisocius sp.]